MSLGDLLVGALIVGEVTTRHHNDSVARNRIDVLERESAQLRGSARLEELAGDAGQDLAIYSSQPPDKRQQYLVEAMLDPRYSDPGLARSPRFQKVRKEAIRLYLENHASDQLRELHRLTESAGDDPELRQAYVDTFMTELTFRKQNPGATLPSMSPQERAAFTDRLNSLRSEGTAAATVLDMVRQDPLNITPELAASLDRVRSVRESLQAYYPSSHDGSDPVVTPLTSRFRNRCGRPGDPGRSRCLPEACRRSHDRAGEPRVCRAAHGRSRPEGEGRSGATGGRPRDPVAERLACAG